MLLLPMQIVHLAVKMTALATLSVKPLLLLLLLLLLRQDHDKSAAAASACDTTDSVVVSDACQLCSVSMVFVKADGLVADAWN